ncbi:helix-turn-helix domain-containing protein [Moraxella oblonga]|uniref:helix-turn-helix domain-containing protein n=1 Tax=Moraxella oblonga TaxID=200413 RepID=UPI00082B9BED|nr:helix-turn-helix transcriptional regulator [Moraxella oblonga]
MNVQTTFIKRLKEARKTRKLTQEKLGIMVGLDEFVASTRINRYEKGVHEPDFGILERMAIALDVPVAYFFADDELAKIILQHHSSSVW